MNLNEPFAWLLFSFYLATFAISIVVFMLQIGVGYALLMEQEGAIYASGEKIEGCKLWF